MVNVRKVKAMFTKTTKEHRSINVIFGLELIFRSLAVTRDSGTLLLAFLAAGMVDPAIVQSTLQNVL